MSKKKRPINPCDIQVPPGYKIEAYATDLTTPINITFTAKGEMLVGDAGITDGNGKVLLQTPEGFKVIADGFNTPLTGITCHQGKIYVAHRGFITTVTMDGTKEDILAGLPSWGDHHNNRVVFGPDEKMYFGQGTATNSGVVGLDNGWVKEYPFFHDRPGQTITLVGRNYYTENKLTAAPEDIATTGAYSPYDIPTHRYERVKGVTRANGSIMRANPDGSELELVAWGLRNPFRIRFDRMNRLFCANHGIDIRGSRPIANSPDEFHQIQPGCWYGWPDFTGGLPVTMPYFKPEGHPQPQFLLAEHPMIPPEPFTTFTPHAAVMGFDFNYESHFGPVGSAYIAEFGAEDPRTTGGKIIHVGHKVSQIDMRTGAVIPFATNRSGMQASEDQSGGFERPIDVVFGPDHAMYIADFGLQSSGNPKKSPTSELHEEEEHNFIPGTGVIWKVTRE